MKISIVICFYNEAENVDAVLRETRALHPEAEIIAVNDGSNDGTLERIRAHPGIRVISWPANLGQSAALYRGVHEAAHEVCVTLDGDGQNDPADIPKLLSRLGPGRVVCGYRELRRDSWARRAGSHVANWVRRAVLQDGIRDTGCTLKAFWKRDFRFVAPFQGLHRFMPAFFKRAGLTLIEVPVNHRARRFGQSKYTLSERAWKGLFDLVGVRWLLSRQIPWPENEKICYE